MTAVADTLWIAPPVSAAFPYRVLGRVGEGAMGEVFRAEDVELGRIIAIKRVRPAFLSGLVGEDAERALRRFQQEARAAASIQHPGITTVHAIGTVQGLPFIAMEWIDGKTLEDRLDAGPPFTFTESVRIVLELLDVLEAAHAAGVVHRDIKPGNLMIGSGGRLKVTDFGIARTANAALVETQAGMIIGTPHYAAPEQLSGQSIDCRTDLYAVGGVLFELVTGQRAFDGASVYELILNVVTTPAPAPSTVIAGLPADFDAFMKRALAKSPDERFASAREMAEALQHFLGSPPANSSERLVAAEVTLPGAVRVAGATAFELVRGVIDLWPSTVLPPLPVPELIDRLLEKPLHTSAFTGALRVGTALVLISDCAVHAAFDSETGESGDRLLAGLKQSAGGTLSHLPNGAEPRLLRQLAAVTFETRPRMTGLQSNIVDLPALALSLGTEGFDGVLRLERPGAFGLVLFNKGQRLLDVFGDGWPFEPEAEPWTDWIRRGRCAAAVEETAIDYPALTFRRRLSGTSLDVVRPGPSSDVGHRVDTRALADAISLIPVGAAPPERQSLVLSLLDKDPATALARWLVADLDSQFVQFGRAGRWSGLLAAVRACTRVQLYERHDKSAMDVTLLDEKGHAELVATRSPIGDRESVSEFLARCVEWRQSPGGNTLSAAVLVAPRFDDDALDAYMGFLAKASRTGRGLLRRLTTHREGWLDAGDGGLHVLLVEEHEGRRRPLVPEQS